MVVAHPDDETLWGGAHLTEGGWFVVCLTNGYNEVRKNEFYEVIKEFGCEGMILSYPDLLSNGQRSTWTTECTSIAKDLNTVLKYNTGEWLPHIIQMENMAYSAQDDK